MAETVTIDRMQRAASPAVTVIALALGAAVASGLVAFVLVSATQRQPATADHRAPIGTSQHPAPIDAARDAPGAAPDDAIPRDAINVQPSPATPAHSGYLYVVSMPILTITIDDKPEGESPRTIALPAGKHHVRLVNPQNNIDLVLPDVIIRDNETTTIDRMPK